MNLSEMTFDQLTEKLAQVINTKLGERDAVLQANIIKAIEDKQAAALAVAAEEARKNAKHFVPGLTKDSDEIKNYSIARLLRGGLEARQSGRGEAALKEICPLEYGLHLEAMKTKDQAGSMDSYGGYLVPAQVMQASLIPLLQESLSLNTMGVTNMDGLTGSPVLIPKRTGGATGYWINHDVTSGATAPPITDQTFGQLALTKHTLAARCRLSNDLIQMSTPAAETVIREQLVYDLSLQMEIAALNGTGVDGQPRGILQTTGINTVGSFGSMSASTAYDKLVQMIIELRTDNALRGNLGWIMGVDVFSSLLKSKDPTDGSQPKGRRMLDDTPFTSLLGYKYLVTNNVPAGTIIFANWADMIIGKWGGMTLKMDDLSVLGLLQSQILVSMNCDIQVRHPESFVLATSVTA